MGGQLHADPRAISEYARNLNTYGLKATIQPRLDLTQMTPLAYQAFETMSAGGILAEAAMMISAVQTNSAMFEQFLADVGTGIEAIANAAQVCADTYSATDAENAESIDTINYAFADPGATRPAGLNGTLVPGKTLLDLELEALNSGGGQTPLAVINPDGGQTVVSLGNYTLTMYPDGSSRAVTVSYPTGSYPTGPYPTGGGVSVETVLTGPNGAVLGRTVQTTEPIPSYAGGGTVQTIENYQGKASTGTVITTAPDGTKIIQTTRNGKPTNDAPVVVKANQGPSTGTEGPVQTALDTYGPDWQFDAVKNYGDAQPVIGEEIWGGAGPPDSYAPH